MFSTTTARLERAAICRVPVLEKKKDFAVLLPLQMTMGRGGIWVVWKPLYLFAASVFCLGMRTVPRNSWQCFAVDHASGNDKLLTAGIVQKSRWK